MAVNLLDCSSSNALQNRKSVANTTVVIVLKTLLSFLQPTLTTYVDLCVFGRPRLGTVS